MEVIRILLKHPYDRQPDSCSLSARAAGSNWVIGDSYRLQKVEIEKPADFSLPSNHHFEFYARSIQRQLQLMDVPGLTDEDSNNQQKADIAANWQQDDLMTAQVNEVIRGINSWGSLSGHLVKEIIASPKYGM